MARPHLRPVFRRARLPRAGRSTSPRRPSPSRSRRPTARCCSPASRSSAASRPGWPPAASSSAPSGATAATSRPTGRPTGCTAKRPRCRPLRSAAAAQGQRRPRRRPTEAAVDARVRDEMRRNTYDDDDRHRDGLGRARAGDPRGRAATTTACSAPSPSLAKLRDQYAMTDGALPDEGRPPGAAAFFFWTVLGRGHRPPRRDRTLLHQQLAARAAGRQHDVDIGRDVVDGQHHPAARRHRRDAVAARQRQARGRGAGPPKADPLLSAKATPSMKATRKYFFVVIGLMLLQIGMGVITAHYAVEGQCVLRHPAGRSPALRRQPHRAHPDRHLLDRHRLARHRPVHRAAARRATSPSSRSSASTCCSGR